MKRSLVRSFYMGVFYCPVGICAGLHVSLNAIGSGYEIFYIYAGFAAFLTSFGSWFLLIETRKSFHIWLGILSGILCGIISHYVCWYIMIVSANIQHYFFNAYVSSLGEPPMNLVEGLSGAFILSCFSLLFYGWITTIAGGFTGGIYCWYVRRNKNRK